MNLSERVLQIAASAIGVMEVPPGSNRGPEVDTYIGSVGLDPEGHYPWCAGFVYFCFRRAAAELDVRPNPCPRTGSALGMWAKAKPEQRLTPDKIDQVRPGMLFVLDLGHGAGHVGFIESMDVNRICTTIEGNTNTDGSREGVGVFGRKRAFWPTPDKLRGFLDFTVG